MLGYTYRLNRLVNKLCKSLIQKIIGEIINSSTLSFLFRSACERKEKKNKWVVDLNIKSIMKG